MKTHFIKTPEKRRIIEVLKERFGIENLPYLLIESGKEKIRGYSGSLSKDEIMELSKIARIEIVGLYLMNIRDELRLSFDATQMLQNQIQKNIVEISKEQFE